MNTLYPDATAEELTLSDNICIICRYENKILISILNFSNVLIFQRGYGKQFEKVALWSYFPHFVLEVSSSNIFAASFKLTISFRSWFQRQQTCPTCRLNILRTPITAAQPQQQPLINNNVNHNARPNEPAVVAQQNPFLNLLNQGLGNQTPAAASTSTTTIPAPPMFPMQGAPMPPPFFFPSMPFMPPYSIPPPPMPQNLDQLTLEELRAMEGNERKHIEERLKLLRNVQTMLNASATLMSQYQAVVANLPPIPIQTQPASSSSTSAASTAGEETIKSEEKQVSEGEVKLEDIGSEESFPDSTNIPSSSKLATLDSPAQATSSSFIATESSATNGESEEANEIRKRRLQKFLQSD